MSKALAIAAATVLVWVAAGCGEKSTYTVYKQGEYRGKPDNQPWANDRFKNDQVAWEKQIKARNNGQNEYTRIVSQ